MAYMTIHVPDEIARAAEALSEEAGVSTEHVLVDAQRAHFPPITPALKEGLDAWNLALDEDARRVDVSLEHESDAAR
jgi:hypothetical protein